MNLTERQQVALAKNLSDICAGHMSRFPDDLSPSRRPWESPSQVRGVPAATFNPVEPHSTHSSSSGAEREGVWMRMEANNGNGSSGGQNLKTTMKRRRGNRFTPKASTLHARRDQRAVRDAALTLLDISDRIPFSGVKSSGVKVWTKFDHETRNCGTVKDLLRQALWFLGQVKEGIKCEAWCSFEPQWIDSCRQCSKATSCKELVQQLEGSAINWTAVARSWAAERGMGGPAWPVSWAEAAAAAETHVEARGRRRVEKWRSCVEARIGGQMRQLGLTFVLGVPGEVAAAGPELLRDEAEANDAGGAQEWEGSHDGDAWEAEEMGGSGSDVDGEGRAGRAQWGLEGCDVPPRSSLVASSRSPDAAMEPVGTLDGPAPIFPAPALDPLPPLPPVMEAEAEDLVQGLWRGWD